MSEHRIARVTPKGDGYQQVQQLRARPRLFTTSAELATTGVRLAKKPYRLVQREPAKPGIRKRIDESVRRAVKFGLGKLARLQRRARRVKP